MASPEDEPKTSEESERHKDTEDDNLPDAAPPPFYRPYWSKHFLVTAIAAIVAIWAFCWLYVGAFWNPTTRLGNLHVAVLDCDVVPPTSAVNASFAPLLPSLLPGPLAGSLLNSSIWNASNSASRALYWERRACPGAPSASGTGGGCGPREAECVANLMEHVLQGDVWALVYFPSSFSANYLSWFAGSGVTPAFQQPTVTYVTARGRDYSTFTYINQVVAVTLLPRLSTSLTTKLAASGTVMRLLSPGFLAAGIRTREDDLAPVTHFGQHFATYVFCIMIWLGSAFVVSASFQFKLPVEAELLSGRCPPSERPSRLLWALWVKGSIALLFLFIEMILLCIVVWAIGDGHEQWHYNAGYAIAFGWYLSWSYIAVNAVLIHVLGMERFSAASAFFLILQLVTSSAVMTPQLSHRFFYLGQGLPFYYGVRGFRTIFFGTCTNKMWINWLVLTAYNVLAMPVCFAFLVRRTLKAASQAKEGGGGRGDPAGAAAAHAAVCASAV